MRQRRNGDDDLRALDRVARASGTVEDAQRALAAVLRHGIDPFPWAWADPAPRFVALWHEGIRPINREPNEMTWVDHALWSFECESPIDGARRTAMVELMRPLNRADRLLPGIYYVGAADRAFTPRRLIGNPLIPLFTAKHYEAGAREWRITEDQMASPGQARALEEMDADLALVLEAHVALGWPLDAARRRR